MSAPTVSRPIERPSLTKSGGEPFRETAFRWMLLACLSVGVVTLVVLLTYIVNVLYFLGAIVGGQVAWRGARQRGALAEQAATIAAQADTLRRRAVVDERLRRGDELEDLFDTFLQMTYSLRAMQAARLATLEATLRRAEAQSSTPADVVDGMRALRAQLVLGIEPRRGSINPPPPAK